MSLSSAFFLQLLVSGIVVVLKESTVRLKVELSLLKSQAVFKFCEEHLKIQL